MMISTQPTVNPPHPVTQYHLLGAGMKNIVFKDDGVKEMSLEYEGKAYSGRALHHHETAFGRTISVELDSAPDLKKAFFSLAVPEAYCPSGMRSIPVSTFAVFSFERAPSADPRLSSGQARTYKIVQLDGLAW